MKRVLLVLLSIVIIVVMVGVTGDADPCLPGTGSCKMLIKCAAQQQKVLCSYKNIDNDPNSYTFEIVATTDPKQYMIKNTTVSLTDSTTLQEACNIAKEKKLVLSMPNPTPWTLTQITLGRTNTKTFTC